jgi:GSH-dependent disulfide-bond oxidoreductase
MIELYTWTTPNGRKVSIALEELGLPHRVHAVDIDKGEQFRPEYSSISPNNKIPAIVDHETGITLMESGAILIYLAQKTGKLFPPDGEQHWRVLEWLMWQMGGLGPMLGQAHHFLFYKPTISEYASKRYADEAQRLYRVLDRRLESRGFIAERFSIADIAVWPWVARFERQKIDLNAFPNVLRWYLDIAARPAVRKGYQVPADAGPIPIPERAL